MIRYLIGVVVIIFFVFCIVFNFRSCSHKKEERKAEKQKEKVQKEKEQKHTVRDFEWQLAEERIIYYGVEYKDTLSFGQDEAFSIKKPSAPYCLKNKNGNEACGVDINDTPAKRLPQGIEANRKILIKKTCNTCGKKDSALLCRFRKIWL